MLQRKVKQKDKKRLSIFVRQDQWEEMVNIRDSEGVYMLDVVEELIDLGLSVYYGNPRDIDEDSPDPAYLYD